MDRNELTVPESTVAAIATPAGSGGIAVIRISGPDAVGIASSAWKGKDLSAAESHTLHLGEYISTDGNVLDQCVASVFLAPNSFTGEDTVELSVHGSPWIQREVLSDLVRRGAEPAGRGEFTKRAFMNGKLDLVQAEGIADLIASSSKASHSMAMSQTKGNFSKRLALLREKLVEFASLLELELDFSEEDVEFADKSRLLGLAHEIQAETAKLAASYSAGAPLKHGIPAVISGIPNAGKSSLLNLLSDYDKAIVSDIPGTTRDAIECETEIGGIRFRFIDTAGLRESADPVENLGIEKALEHLRSSRIVIWIIDPTANFGIQKEMLRHHIETNPDKKFLILIGKSDLPSSNAIETGKRLSGTLPPDSHTIIFSNSSGEGLEELKETLAATAKEGYDTETDIIVTNARHHASLMRANESITRAICGMESHVPSDFIAQDIRQTAYHIGELTGAITTDTLLHTIFSRFCVGK